ncbi:Uncharacterised protein [Yersinia frederiksenii]|uniref:Uncharacterized protein n=1 Tax=Yersinia frederiksenii TaxID=29484 RepID=A0A380PPW0_YERFR|nr:Uncharacterised protein [Yersinia frederiksenii]SUP75610.1 Uncharacterised protein [Yersinia frederiksenii]
MQNSFCGQATSFVLQIFLIRAIECVVWGISYNDL